MTTELERAVAFEDALLESAAERIERVPLGSAVFTDSLPVVWSLNLLRVEQPGPTVEEIAAEAERLQGEARLEHRRVSIQDEDAGRALEAGFVSLGWKPISRTSSLQIHRHDHVEEVLAAFQQAWAIRSGQL